MPSIQNDYLHDINENETCFPLLVESVEDYAICLLDPSGYVRSWNTGAARINGYEAGEAIGLHVSRFYPPSSGQFEQAMQHLEDALSQGRCAVEDWRVRKDGSFYRAYVVFTPVYDAQGVLRGFAKIVRDLSSRKRLEDRFHQLVQEAPNAMIMVNASGVITLVNRLAETLFGYRTDELLGLPMELLVPERLRGNHAGLRTSFFNSPEARPMGAGRELHALRKDGSEFPVEIGLNPIETEEGMMVLAGIVDITARKQAQRQLEMALQEKTTLLNEVHHRVKNNLQVIISLLNMQSNYVTHAATRDVLQDSQARVRSMALIHQLLYERHDFSRIDLGEYLERFCRLLLASFGSLVAHIELDLDAEQDKVFIELQRATPCGLLINELMTNALKHAYPQGKGVVYVRLTLNDHRDAHLIVSDHGVGMPESGRRSVTPSLGLQLVPLLAEQMGARIAHFDNEPGVRYEIVFPVLALQGDSL